jgi:hypothetical protein
MTGHRQAFVRVILLVLAAAPFARAEDLTVEEEAAIMAEEDEAEAALSIDKKPPGALSGRIQLNGDADMEADAVVGMLVVNGRGYMLRLSKPQLFPVFQRLNGKTAMVQGKVRMRGKYFIAEGILPPTPGVERPDRARRAGM